MTYPYGVHLAQVEVDRETGGVRVLRYFIAYEVGRAVNPALVEGQLIGGAAQGLGGALMEEFRYDAEGQPQCTSFMDYLIPLGGRDAAGLAPRCARTPAVAGNPLGVKGAGEGASTGRGRSWRRRSRTRSGASARSPRCRSSPSTCARSRQVRFATSLIGNESACSPRPSGGGGRCRRQPTVARMGHGPAPEAA